MWHSGKGKTIEWINIIRGFFLLLQIVLLVWITYINAQQFLSCSDSQIHPVRVFIAPGLQETRHWGGWGYHRLMWWVSDFAHYTQISQDPSCAGLKYGTYSLLQRKSFPFVFWESQMNGPEGQQESAIYCRHFLLPTSLSCTSGQWRKARATWSQVSLEHVLVDSAKLKSVLYRASSPGFLWLSFPER